MDETTKKRDRRALQPLDALRVPEAHLRLKTVEQATGLSATTIRRYMAEGRFPQPVRHSARCTRWIAREVSAWLKATASPHAG